MKDTLKVAGRIGAELGAAKAENDRLRGLLEAALYYVPSNKTELRALIDAALSQQAEPVRGPGTEDTASMDSNSAQEQFTAVDMATAAAQGFRDGQAAVEPATAQDERELPPPYGWVAVGEFFTDRAKAIEAAEKTPCIEVYSRPQMLTRPAQTEQQPPYPHEAMDVIATSRYQVVASGSGPLSRYYVRAGDGKCELYRGGKSDCEHVARKLAGAFLDGGLTAFGLYAAPIAQTAPQPEQSGLVEALEEIAAGEKTVWRDDHFEVENDMAIDYLGIAKAALDAYRAALSAQGAGDASA
ncbi:hypothetical protein [Stutzerimonas nitrititolerans]|uniref:hypothetical protein n=1 Tax=Stutzerimonas nitrititolerans TaxID=2482751 RepID=UPI0028ACDD5A|nr:hypothetical protein [Stutzerimonas nitrititolerans]